MTDNPALLALLDVQAHDTKLVQITHQLDTLSERDVRDGAAKDLADLRAALAEREATAHDLAGEQKRIDDEVESLKAKRDGFDATLYSGTVTNPRELQDLQDEIASLGRRITQLEDSELDVMEQVEPVTAAVAQLRTEVAAAEETLQQAEAALNRAEAELRAQMDEEAARRAVAVEPVPAELLREYESLRGPAGVGIARLDGAQCGACHLGLSAMESARLAKLGPDEIAHCEECGRILVP